MKYILIGTLVAGLAACGHMPETYDTVPDESPSLVIMGVPPFTQVLVDGVLAASTGEEGRRELAVDLAAGRRTVTILTGGATIYDREVFVQGATRKEIDLR